MNSHWLSLKVTFFFFFNYCAGKMLLSFICFVCVHFLSPGFTSYWEMVLDRLWVGNFILFVRCMWKRHFFNSLDTQFIIFIGCSAPFLKTSRCKPKAACCLRQHLGPGHSLFLCLSLLWHTEGLARTLSILLGCWRAVFSSCFCCHCQQLHGGCFSCNNPTVGKRSGGFTCCAPGCNRSIVYGCSWAKYSFAKLDSESKMLLDPSTPLVPLRKKALCWQAAPRRDQFCRDAPTQFAILNPY